MHKYSTVIYVGPFRRGDVFFEPEFNRFWAANEAGEPVPLSEEAVRRHLIHVGYSPETPPGETISPLERALNEIECAQRVISMRRKPRFRRGLYRIDDDLVLVDRNGGAA